jgi:hypothetical protein
MRNTRPATSRISNDLPSLKVVTNSLRRVSIWRWSDLSGVSLRSESVSFFKSAVMRDLCIHISLDSAVEEAERQ